MVNSQGVAILDGIQDLEKDPFDQGIVAHKVALFGDAGEQITLGAEFDDHIGTVDGIHYTDQGNNIGMLASQMVELDFALLELELPGIKSDLVQCFDGIHHIGVDVDGGVDHAVGTNSKNACQFQPVG